MLTETILLEQNKRLRERVDELEETIRQFREAAAHAPDLLPADLPHLRPLERKTLIALLARPEFASREFIYRCLYPHHDDVALKIIDVMVCKLRRKLHGIVKIETIWGRGYRAALVKKVLTVSMHDGVSEPIEARAA